MNASAAEFLCPEAIDFGGVETPIDEVASIVMMTSGKKSHEDQVDYALRYFARKFDLVMPRPLEVRS